METAHMWLSVVSHQPISNYACMFLGVAKNSKRYELQKEVTLLSHHFLMCSAQVHDMHDLCNRKCLYLANYNIHIMQLAATYIHSYVVKIWFCKIIIAMID